MMVGSRNMAIAAIRDLKTEEAETLVTNAP
jgi:hypothetical protein